MLPTRHFLHKGTLCEHCKCLLEHFKGTKVQVPEGMEAIALIASMKFQALRFCLENCISFMTEALYDLIEITAACKDTIYFQVTEFKDPLASLSKDGMEQSNHGQS